MIDRSKWSFLYLAIFVLCITRGVEAQDVPSPDKSAAKKSQGEEKAAGETQKRIPSQSEPQNQKQKTQEAQSATKAEPDAQQKNDEQTKSDGQTETPPIVSESQSRNVGAEMQPKPTVSRNSGGSPIDQAPPPDRDQEAAQARIGLGLEIDTVWNTDPGFDLFSDDDVSTQVGVWFSYDLLQITKQLTLAGEVGLGIGGVEDQPREDLDLTWSMSSFKAYLAANLRLRVFPWMFPHLKLAGGALFGTLEFQLNDPVPRQTTSEDTTSPLGTIGAGVSFQTPTRMFESSDGAFASLSLGLLIEAGYTIASSMSMTLKTDRDEDPIENRTAALGELDLSGPYIRTSVLVRF